MSARAGTRRQAAVEERLRRHVYAGKGAELDKTRLVNMMDEMSCVCLIDYDSRWGEVTIAYRSWRRGDCLW